MNKQEVNNIKELEPSMDKLIEFNRYCKIMGIRPTRLRLKKYLEHQTLFLRGLKQ